MAGFSINLRSVASRKGVWIWAVGTLVVTLLSPAGAPAQGRGKGQDKKPSKEEHKVQMSDRLKGGFDVVPQGGKVKVGKKGRGQKEFAVQHRREGKKLSPQMRVAYAEWIGDGTLTVQW